MSSCVGLLVAPFSVGDSWVQAAPDDLWCSRATQSGFDAVICVFGWCVCQIRGSEGLRSIGVSPVRLLNAATNSLGHARIKPSLMWVITFFHRICGSSFQAGHWWTLYVSGSSMSKAVTFGYISCPLWHYVAYWASCSVRFLWPTFGLDVELFSVKLRWRSCEIPNWFLTDRLSIFFGKGLWSFSSIELLIVNRVLRLLLGWRTIIYWFPSGEACS
ncbi:hypothetical protein F2Q69_00028715 [Brassica cretica]|uniref:Uncharacterized protein n=1 Tax=Brassica cretica TaxID=69181 RepID=A0A8S9SBB8_BRACR|nr:hypothetical protein F2Q69_00028715 [Brassica cretica]